MNCWQILGIEPTSSEADIRRAYSRQLKQHRPDSDPQGYQQLREAFERAKSLASAGEFEEDRGVEEAPTAAGLTVMPWSTAGELTENHQEAQGLTLFSKALYSAEEMQQLAGELVENEIKGLVTLEAFYQRVTAEGNLIQQQQFHQDLAAALAEQPGLTEWFIERVSEKLGWELNNYSDGYLLPHHLHYALYEQSQATERERIWKTVEIEQAQGSYLSRMALKLLRSDRTSVPFYVRLVPGLITKMAQQVNALNHTFPELTRRLNPAMLQWLDTPRFALSWQGIFLLCFWAAVFHYALPPVAQNGTPIFIALSTALYYLYISDVIFISLQRQRWLTGIFLVLDYLYSLLCLFGLFAAVLFIVIRQMPSRGEGFHGLFPLLVGIVEMLAIWSLWSTRDPALRQPGKAVARLFTSPWRLLATLGFTFTSYPLVSAYGVFCYLLLRELITLL